MCLFIVHRPLRRKLFKPKPKPARTVEAKKKRDTEKYPLREPCADESCKRKCCNKMSQERREVIYKQFWAMRYDERRAWIFANVESKDPKRLVANQTTDRSRKWSRFYHLPNEDGAQQKVCQTFFLATLGYKSSQIVKGILWDFFIFTLEQIIVLNEYCT